MIAPYDHYKRAVTWQAIRRVTAVTSPYRSRMGLLADIHETSYLRMRNLDGFTSVTQSQCHRRRKNNKGPQEAAGSPYMHLAMTRITAMLMPSEYVIDSCVANGHRLPTFGPYGELFITCGYPGCSVSRCTSKLVARRLRNPLLPPRKLGGQCDPDAGKGNCAYQFKTQQLQEAS